MQKKFLEKYFPASRTIEIRKEISGIRQTKSESLHEFWERFKQLCRSCPHQISEQLLMIHFYEGLNASVRNQVDASAGGTLMNKTVADARKLINDMAENAQQFSVHQEVEEEVKGATETTTNQQIDALSAVVQELVQLQLQQNAFKQTKFCNTCTGNGHAPEDCPISQERLQSNPDVLHSMFKEFADTFIQGNQKWKDEFKAEQKRIFEGLNEYVNALTLRTGKQLPEPVRQQHTVDFEEMEEDNQPSDPESIPETPNLPELERQQNLFDSETQMKKAGNRGNANLRAVKNKMDSDLKYDDEF
jgi:hypothetical protein